MEDGKFCVTMAGRRVCLVHVCIWLCSSVHMHGRVRTHAHACVRGHACVRERDRDRDRYACVRVARSPQGEEVGGERGAFHQSNVVKREEADDNAPTRCGELRAWEMRHSSVVMQS
eukprot:5199830-Pleurochrysis_carterae.AAC.2